MTRYSGWHHVAFGLAVVGCAFGVSNDYYLQLITLIGIHTLLALGLNMLMGYAGQISLGHAAFYGLGAYGSGVLTVHWHWSPWLALPLILAAAGATAYLVGLPTLRLHGYYLGMGTLGLGMIAHVAFREWAAVTGGSSGLVGIPPLVLSGVTLSFGRNGLLLVWAVVLAAFFLCERLVDSRVGRALRAIRDSEGAAAASGIDTGRLKAMVFALSAVLAAAAGFLYAHWMTFISPGSFDFMVSIRIVTMVVIGGMASIWGSLIGASLITLLPEWLHVFSDYEMIVYGLILMVIMIFMPQGLFRGFLDFHERVRSSAEPTHP